MKLFKFQNPYTEKFNRRLKPEYVISYKTHEQHARDNFQNDVKNHELEVISDDGKLHRHIRMKKPDTSNMYYDIVTWSGYLCFTGDMGTFVFSRIHDMFEFFRDGRDYASIGDETANREPSINLNYWAEKLQAVDKDDGYEIYSPELFKKSVMESAIEFCEYENLLYEERLEFMADVEETVCSRADDGEMNAHDAVSSFEYKGHQVFHDTFEWNFKEWSYRYVWACMAIVHAIQEYDNWKKGN